MGVTEYLGVEVTDRGDFCTEIDFGVEVTEVGDFCPIGLVIREDLLTEVESIDVWGTHGD